MSAYASLNVPPSLTRQSTSILPPPTTTPSFLIDNSKISYKHQYSNIYFIRLRKLRDIVEQNAHQRWRGLSGHPILVERVLEVETGQLCYIVGTVYMDMPMKPNIIEDIARDHSIPPPPPPKKIFSQEDSVMLEDESGRIRLAGDKIKQASLVTGIIIAALGMETPAGDFEVIDYCLPGMAPQEQDTIESAEGYMDVDEEHAPQNEWIAVISGLDVGSASPSDAQIQMLVEFLTGEGGADDQALASHISRLIIAGDSLSSAANVVEPGSVPEDRKSRRYANESTSFSPHPILNLSSMLQDIASVMPVHILPGATDPAGVILPQQPFPPAMFGDAARYSTFSCETNPTYLSVSTEAGPSNPKTPPVKRTLLVNSGQPLNDMFKYLPTPPNTRLSMLENTIMWRHMAPTAPDTLWCHPFRDDDPFIMRRTPDIYIVGGQKKFGTRLVTGQKSVSKGKEKSNRQRCRMVLIPSFALTGILVLVNLRNLDVKRINFSVHGMGAGGDTEMKDGSLREPSPTPAEPMSSAPKSSLDYGFM